jgi:hypothetical protein
MKTTRIWHRSTIAALLGVFACLSYAQAGGDYVVIQRNAFSMNDGDTSRRLQTFTLPDNTRTSASTANSAVLQLMVQDVNWAFNEIYINPPTTVCTDDGEDANQSASVHTLSPHVANDGTPSEVFTEHRAFSSARLQPGVACTQDTDCATSLLCQSGTCRNRLMICIRTETGQADVDATPNDVDGISVHSIVLHYKR